MNTPVWVVAAVAGFGTAQWLQLLWLQCRRACATYETLVTPHSPTQQEISKRRAYAREYGELEFNLTFQQGDKELLRVNATGFVVDGRGLVNADPFRFKAISSDPVKAYIREAQSDVPIGVSVLKLGGSLRRGDELMVGRSGIRLGVS